MQNGILLVEDDEIVARLIRGVLERRGHQVTRVAEARQAWELLQGGGDFSAVLLDRELPDMNGMELLRRLKGDPAMRQLPVIMETGTGDLDSIREGLAAGAYYYLTKPLAPKLLAAVVDAAIEQYREMQALRDSSLRVEHALKYLDQGTFYCRTMTEARNLAQGLALVYPDPQRAAYGLQELLYNAVEHGNLGISYAEKKRLLIDGQLVQTIDERLADPVLGSRRVTARLVRQSGWLSLTIEDQGEGFDWSSYVDLDPERSTDPNGRGIALTRMTSFDSLDYEGSGNRVVVKMMTGNE